MILFFFLYESVLYIGRKKFGVSSVCRLRKQTEMSRKGEIPRPEKYTQ